MKNRIIALLVGMVLLLFSFLAADPYSEPLNPFETAITSSFDSLNVRCIGGWTFGPSEKIAIDSLRNLAFVGSGGGVYVLDVSDSTNPVKISESIHTRDWIRSLYFDESTQRLCIANYYAGFEIWDMADPQEPEGICFYRDLFPVYDIVCRDSLVYVSNYYTGLHIFNISDPINPEQIGFFQISGSNSTLVLKDSYAYVINPNLSIIDVSNPEKPELVGFWNGPGNCSNGCIKDTLAFVRGYYIDTRYLWTLNVTDPYAPQVVNTFTLPYEYPDDITVKDSIVYLACDTEGFSLINVSDPINPYICGYVNLCSRDIAIALPFAYVAASWCQGMRIFDVADPSNPYQIGQYKGPKQTEDVWVVWPYAYIANNEGGFRILDISNAQDPYEISSCEFRRTIVQSVFVVDSLAYITFRYENHGLGIINVKDSFNPSMIARCSLPGMSYDVFAKDTFAYITGTAGLRMVNIADPINPYEAGYFACGNCKGLFVRDSLAYFATRDFHIVDISNPSNIQEVGYYEMPAFAHGVCIDGDVAYVTGNLGPYENLMLLDISDPRNPTKISSLETPGSGRNCVVHESYAYISDFDGGLRIIDVSSPANPIEVGYYNTPTFLALNCFLSDSYIYVAAACLGLQIYEFYGAGIEEESEKPVPYPASLRLLQNPIKGDCIELLMSLSKQHSAEITLYNQIGQKLKTYQFSGLKVGENKLHLDAAGLPAGIYFLKAGGNSVGKVVKVR